MDRHLLKPATVLLTIVLFTVGAWSQDVSFSSGRYPSKAKLLGNTIGCLDGYDHLPCIVYDSGVLSSTSLTGVADFDMLSPSPTGAYSVCGTLYIASTTASQGTYQLYLDFFYPGSWYNSGAGTSVAVTNTLNANAVGKVGTCVPVDVDNDNGIRKLVGQVRASGSPNNSVAYRYRIFVRREH